MGFRLYDFGLVRNYFKNHLKNHLKNHTIFNHSISAPSMLCLSIFYDGFSLLYIVFGSILDNKKGDILGDLIGLLIDSLLEIQHLLLVLIGEYWLLFCFCLSVCLSVENKKCDKTRDKSKHYFSLAGQLAGVATGGLV